MDRSSTSRSEKIKEGCENKKKQLLSILGKLYLHRINFPDNSGTLAFVSNMRCALRFDSRVKNDPEIFFARLITPCRTKIANQLREEHGLDKGPDCNNCLKFVVTDLNVDKHSRDVQGELTQLCGNLWPDGGFPVLNLYRAIAEQLRARSDFERLPSTVSELLSRKAISSSEVQNLFEKLAHVPRLSLLWQPAQHALMHDNVGPLQIRELRHGWNLYGIQRQDPSNLTVKHLQQRIQSELRAIDPNPNLKTHVEIVNLIADKLAGVGKAFDGQYLKGAILLEFFDDQTRELSPINTQSSGEAP
jgi:hypothetical protein